MLHNIRELQTIGWVKLLLFPNLLDKLASNMKFSNKMGMQRMNGEDRSWGCYKDKIRQQILPL